MENYYLGLDIGTESIGWAVTDENYNLTRKKGKDLWGVRIFNEAKPASGRRKHRSSRKRYYRKSMRLQLLRDIFEDEINKVDKNFFKRLDESKFWEEDKKVSGKYSLFNDEGFNDVDYFKKYKTIYHLRKDLIEHSEKKDIRLYFLAINQIMKRRGHFLFEGEIKNVTEYEPNLENLMRILNEKFITDEDVNKLDKEYYDQVFEILLDNSLKKTTKKNAINNINIQYELGKDFTKKLDNIFALVISGKCKVKDIFDDKDILEEVKNAKKEEFNFDNEKYEENLSYFENLFGYEYELIENLKAIYDFILLKDILKGHKYLSEAKIESYNNHHNDLEKLKELIRKYDKNNKIYNLIFRDKDNKSGYVAYLGYYDNKGKKIPVKKSKYEDFIKNVKKHLSGIVDPDDENYKYLLDRIEKEEFLTKQIYSTNTVIPHQVHLIELKEILNNLVKDYPSFNRQEDGYTKAEKIEKIFRFRIPYYVGPLNDYHKNNGGNAWIVKKNNETIRPWNFDKTVDLHKSEEEFIKRMLNQCSYLPGEKVLPKSSLLYQEFMVLDYLNNIRINGNQLKHDIKMQIIDEVYKKHTNVSQRKIRDFLVRNNYIEDTSKIDISGVQEDLKLSLSTYIDFKDILGDSFNENMVEDIVEQITIHTGNKALLINKISERYPEITDLQLKQIVSKKYKDWGRLSKKFLNGLEGCEFETGQIATIIQFMRENNHNLMEILSSRYDFINKIDEIRKENLPNNLEYSVIDSLYVSPSVKKMIWQVIKLNDELIKVLGKTPDKIFIEMARGKEKNPKEKDSRKKQLIKLYNNIRKGNEEIIKKLKSFEDAEFRNRALYLYFLQEGKCMYSGEKIELDEIFNKNLYDLDHIIPQKLKKDDSIINNLVLVKRTLNQVTKGEQYPIPSSIRNNEKVRSLWDKLYRNGFITKEKYNRLIRSNKVSDEELAGFINRQLVETRQATKVVKELFENYYTDSKIITVKAELASDLRKDFKLLKCRELNDLHHAHDAFLNIVVGDVWNKKFTSNPLNFVKNSRKGNNIDYSIKDIFKRNQFVRNEIIWDVEKGIKQITETLNKPSILFSAESFEQKGELFNATIVAKNDIKDDTLYLPLKKDERLKDIKKYGGYKSINGAYFFLVEHLEKNKLVKTIEMLPIYMVERVENNEDELLKYAKDVLNLQNPKILIKRINYRTEIEVNGFRYLIGGKTGNKIVLKPNVQMFWSVEDATNIKLLFNKYFKYKDNGIDLFSDEDKKQIKENIELLNKKFNYSIYKNRINIPNFSMSIINEDEYIKNIEILQNLIKISTREYVADLRAVGLKEKSGKSLINKKINGKKVYIINKSITGIYEKKRRID